MNIYYKITFHTYWHCGSGLAAGADADLLVIKDKDGLPYVPGKTIKGLVREAVDLIYPEKKDSEEYKSAFGISGEEKEKSFRSDSFFKDATLSEIERNYIIFKETSRHFYQTLSSTAITDEGIADDKTLRKIQVCIPCDLEGEILNVPKEMGEAIIGGLNYIKRIGAWRNRGLGRCTFEQVEGPKQNPQEEETDNINAISTVLKFECKLLTDVILNQKSASEGSNTTLDFIPGSNFLGIVAGDLYKDTTIDNIVKLKIFHTKFVRFGDAHPANGNNRTLRMPACLFYAKGEEEKDRTHYVHHLIRDASSEELRKIQLKQERGGYADFMPLEEGKNAIRLKVNTGFAIKSAYNRDLRRSLDKQMFGYQSMGKGMTYFFTIEIDSSLSDYAERIKTALEGIHRVGRSRSAQYGLVEIKACVFNEPESSKQTVKAGDCLVIYADSRLIFLDEDGLTTFQPSFKQLVGRAEIVKNKEEAEREEKILWEKSQIRTFQYAPYNYQRRCFDTDRCGIEKGSVIVVKVSEDVDVCELKTHLGSYQNEGFGKVIYNPDFLKADENGKLVFKIEPKKEEDAETCEDPKTVLTDFLSVLEERRKEDAEIYKAVNAWVNDRFILKNYAKESFASQWGHIRSLALQCKTKEMLIEKLFKGENDKSMKEHEKGYLVHGVAKDKWAGKTQALKDFINSHSPKAVVNLASEMQKKSK